MAIGSLWSGIAIGNTGDQIDTKLHGMAGIELLIGGSLRLQIVQHRRGQFVGGSRWFSMGNRIESDHAMGRQDGSNIGIKWRRGWGWGWCRLRGGHNDHVM